MADRSRPSQKEDPVEKAATVLWETRQVARIKHGREIARELQSAGLLSQPPSGLTATLFYCDACRAFGGPHGDVCAFNTADGCVRCRGETRAVLVAEEPPSGEERLLEGQIVRATAASDSEGERFVVLSRAEADAHIDRGRRRAEDGWFLTRPENIARNGPTMWLNVSDVPEHLEVVSSASVEGATVEVENDEGWIMVYVALAPNVLGHAVHVNGENVDPGPSSPSSGTLELDEGERVYVLREDDAEVAAGWIRGHRPRGYPEDVVWGRALDRVVAKLRRDGEGETDEQRG